MIINLVTVSCILKVRMELVMTSCKGLFCFSSCLHFFFFLFFPKWCTWASVVWDENTGTNIPCVYATLHTRAKYVVHLISHFRDMLSSAAHQFIIAVECTFLWGILLLWCLLAYIINHASPQLGVMTMVPECFLLHRCAHVSWGQTEVLFLASLSGCNHLNLFFSWFSNASELIERLWSPAPFFHH